MLTRIRLASQPSQWEPASEARRSVAVPHCCKAARKPMRRRKGARAVGEARQSLSVVT